MNKKILPALAALAFIPAAALAAPAEPAADAPAEVAAAKKTSTPAGWTDDFAAAKKLAAQENKDLFILFTGSDWCGWCIRLKNEVFSKPGFIEKLSETFVPVFIDMPRDNSLLSENAQKQNKPLVEKFRIQGFPTVLLADADGIVFGQLGYAAGGPEKYLETVLKLTDSGKNSGLYKAKKSFATLPKDSPDRIKILDEALAALPLEEQFGNVEFIEEILAADPDGKLGYRAKYPFFAIVLPLKQEFEETYLNFSLEARKIIEASGEVVNRDNALAAFRQVYAKNPDVLPSIYKKATDARKLFPDNSTGAKQLDDIIYIVGETLKDMK